MLGSVGVPPEGTEIKIVQADSRVEVPVGQVGVLVSDVYPVFGMNVFLY